MSYIIAFVSFSESENVFPVECFRTDLRVGDKVVVRRKDGKLRIASVSHLRYLNWDCQGRVECRLEEATLDEKGNISLPVETPLRVGLATTEALVKSLKTSGWIEPKKGYGILGNDNLTELGYDNGPAISSIKITKNDISFSIQTVIDYDEDLDELIYGNHRFVRHYLAHTTFNLLEGVFRFAASFQNNEEDLERYFVPQGRKDRRTARRNTSGTGMSGIYDAISDGSGSPAYLGDGIWINSGGGMHE